MSPRHMEVPFLWVCPQILGSVLNIAWLHGKRALLISFAHRTVNTWGHTNLLCVCVCVYSHTHMYAYVLVIENLA